MGGNSQSTLKGDSKSTSSSSASSKAHDKNKKSKDIKSTALVSIPRKSPLGEAWPNSVNLPPELQAIVNGYLASHFDVSRYTLDDCKSFTLFSRNAVPAHYAFHIGTHALHGRREEALAEAKQCPESLVCITTARDAFGIGRLAEGSPVDLSAAAGNRRLTLELMNLVPVKLKSEAEKHLARRFQPGWEKETQDRMKQRYLDPLTRFADQLADAKKLPNDVTFKDAIRERKAIIDEFRIAIRPKPDDIPITTGLIFDPQIFLNIDQLFLSKKDRLGGWYTPESGLYWGVGYQSLLGAGSAVIAHIVISGPNNYFDHHRDPAEVVRFKDGAPYFSVEPTVGIGSEFVVSYYGDKYGAAGAICARGRACVVWWAVGTERAPGNLMSSKNFNIAELMQTQDNPLTWRLA